MDREFAKTFVESHYGAGWLNLVDIVFDNAPSDEIEITEVFQKWGGLQIRYKGMDRNFQELVDHVYYISQKMCEVCGKSGGTVMAGGWQSTLCQEHFDALKIKDKNKYF